MLHTPCKRHMIILKYPYLERQKCNKVGQWAPNEEKKSEKNWSKLDEVKSKPVNVSQHHPPAMPEGLNV